MLQNVANYEDSSADHQQTAAATAASSAIIDCWMQDHACSRITSNSIVQELQAKMGCWPPASGLGITLLKKGGEASITLTDVDTALPAANVQKPKGPITGFNFYSKDVRKTILEQHGNQVCVLLLFQLSPMLAHNVSKPYILLAPRNSYRTTT